MKTLINVLILIILSGCATPYTWNKPGGTQQEYFLAHNDCTTKDAIANGRPKDFGSVRAWNRFMIECMGGQGWIYTEK